MLWCHCDAMSMVTKPLSFTLYTGTTPSRQGLFCSVRVVRVGTNAAHAGAKLLVIILSLKSLPLMLSKCIVEQFVAMLFMRNCSHSSSPPLFSPSPLLPLPYPSAPLSSGPFPFPCIYTRAQCTCMHAHTHACTQCCSTTAALPRSACTALPLHCQHVQRVDSQAKESICNFYRHYIPRL